MACTYKYNDQWLSEEEILKVLSERKEFKSLYNNLLKELDENPRAKDVLDRIKRDYPIINEATLRENMLSYLDRRALHKVKSIVSYSITNHAEKYYHLL